MINNKPKYGLLIFILFLTIQFTVGFSSVSYDVYFITYATKDGKTGHSALAIDNYDVYVYDKFINGKIVYEHDTVKTGTLTYFDFWPEKDHFSFGNVGKDTEAKYNKLPSASYEKEITVEYILNNGIPHIKNHPCDGFLVLKTSAKQDYELIQFMDSIIRLNKPFNARRNNCSDFVLYGANHITKKKIRANEFVPFSFSTTPNKLYKKLSELSDIKIIKNPGSKVNGTFFKERILEIIIRKKIN